jgi:hypothetical protein
MFDIERTHLNDAQRDQIRKYERLSRSKTFVPNRPQYDFAHAVGMLPIDTADPKTVFILKSANGVGKTAIVWNVLINIVYGNELDEDNHYGPVSIFQIPTTDTTTGEVIPGFFTEPLYNGAFPKHWPKNIWYVSNKDSLNAIWEEAKEWLPVNDYEEFWEESKDGKNYISRVNFLSTKWTLFFKTIDQDPGTFESANCSIIINDEPCPRAIFAAEIARTRMGGILIMPATPLRSEPWFPEYCEASDDPDLWIMEVPVWTNCIERAGQWDMGMFGIQDKGNLTERKIQMMIRQWERLDPDLLPARVEGKSVHLVGIVYKSYPKYRDQIFTKFDIWVRHPMDYMYRFIVDPHDRKPPACIWLRMDRWGNEQVLREFPSPSDPQFQGKMFVDITDAGHYKTYDFVKFFMQIEKELEIPETRIQDIIDPNFGLKRNAQTGKRVYQEWIEISRQVKKDLEFGREYSFIYDVLDAVEEGHQVVRQKFLPTLDGKFRFQIHETCVNLDQQLRFYRRKRQTILDEEEHGITDKVANKYKDFPDLLRYHSVVYWDYEELLRHPDRYTGSDYKETVDPAHLSEEEKYDWRKHLADVVSTRPEGADGV